MKTSAIKKISVRTKRGGGYENTVEMDVRRLTIDCRRLF